jgi:hypothetical protein
VTRFEEGRLEPEAFVREIGERLELKVEFDDFCDIWGAIFIPGTLISEEFLVALKAAL